VEVVVKDVVAMLEEIQDVVAVMEEVQDVAAVEEVVEDVAAVDGVGDVVVEMDGLEDVVVEMDREEVQHFHVLTPGEQVMVGVMFDIHHLNIYLDDNGSYRYGGE
jgi:deferrochelatase/peroxidase EfeB